MQPPSDQVSPAADEERIPLPPITTPPAPDPSAMIARLRPLDGLLVLALLAFAFLVASFKAANSDVFLHLATGRLVAQGAYPFGQDPFTFAASGWINHAWLYSLGLFAAFSLTGPDGVGLVVIKALAVAATALLMFLGGKRPGERGWIPVMCAAVGVLSMSPRLLLTPLVVSVLLLAAVFFLLGRHEAGSRRVWLIPLLCALWVNCDAWFFLGPLMVLLYAAGAAIQADKEAKTLGVVGAVSLAACLVNPYHVMAFTALPPELIRFGPAMELARDPLFRGWHLTVFEPLYFQTNVGMSAAGVSFFVLVALALASFALAFPKVSYPRALVLVPMLALSLMGYRMIPLFAAVAAPIAALNFLDGADRLFGAEAFARREWRAWAVGGRVLSLLLLIAAGVLSVPGLLQATPYADKRLGFGLTVDEGLKQAALRAAELREQGVIKDGERWLNLGTETVAYFAWFCPGQKCFLDHRIGIYPAATIRDWLTARRSLQGEDRQDREPGREPPEPAWRAVMRGNEIRFAVSHYLNLDLAQPQVALQRLLGAPDEWTVCYLGGRSGLFAWREPGSEQKLDRRAIRDFDAEAFGPDAEPVADVAPARLTFLDALTGEGPPTPAEAWTAEQQITRFNTMAANVFQRETQRRFLAVVAVGEVGAGGNLGQPLSLTMRQREERFLFPRFMERFDTGPPASAYLAIRAARAAILANPYDHQGYRALADAAARVHYGTREDVRTRGLPHVGDIRRGQRGWALREALKLESLPKDVRAVLHFKMYEAFQERRYLDHQIEHLVAGARLQREMGRPNEALEKELRGKERELEQVKNDYVVQSARLPAPQRAIQALNRGLILEAIGVMKRATNKELAVPLDQQGTTALQLLIRTWLELGFVDEARARINPETSPDFDPRMLGLQEAGVTGFDWARVQVAATVGDYDTADATLADLVRQARQSPAPLRTAMAVGDAILHGGRQSARLPGDLLTQLAIPFPLQGTGIPLAWQGMLGVAQQQSVAMLDQMATMTTLRAWLALERGKTADAARLAKEAFDVAELGPSADGGRLFIQLRPLPLAALIRELTTPRPADAARTNR